MVTAIVLAAGSSRRMGAVNKLLLPWNGKPVVRATTENILAAGIGELIMVTGHEPEGITAVVSGLPIRFVHNSNYNRGMTGSIKAGVTIANGHCYMICLADMVLITPAEYALLMKALEGIYDRDDRCILIPEFEGQKGNPVIFSSSWRDAILGHPEEDGCRSLVRSQPSHQFRIPMPSGHILRDVDSPEDYQRLIQPAG